MISFNKITILINKLIIIILNQLVHKNKCGMKNFLHKIIIRIIIMIKQ